MSPVVLLTDHGSDEGSRDVLATAIELVTGDEAVLVDARDFMPGGRGRATLDAGGVVLQGADDGATVRPEIVVIYEIPPAKRRGFEAFQRLLRAGDAVSLGLDAAAWRRATEKDLAAARFEREGIPQMQSVGLSRPGAAEAARVFERLGSDVWARPTVGAGGSDVFHVTTLAELDAARCHYARGEQAWLLARDARNFDADGRRRQLRLVVLGDRVLRACEHLQPDPDAPCNECRGAVSTLLAVEDVPADLRRIAVSATRALGLPFGGVDLAPTAGGLVFEVNVHPVICAPRGLEDVAVALVEAHLDLLRDVPGRSSGLAAITEVGHARAPAA